MNRTIPGAPTPVPTGILGRIGMRCAAAVLAAATLTAVPGVAQQKHKVTVLDFGYGTVRTSVQAYFGTDQDIGKGISDLLVDQLVNGGAYRVVERSAIDKIEQEQNFAQSERADPATASKIGAMLGANDIILGDVTTFGHDDKHYGGGGGGGNWYHGGAGALGLSKNKTIVEITARIVDVNTGEVLASATGHGEVDKSGLSAGGGGGSWWNRGGGAFDMGSSNFQQSAIGQATKAAVADLASNLDAKAAGLPAVVVAAAPPPPPVDGVIADASSADIIINVGTGNGLQVGDTLAVMREGRTILDPVTKKPLRTIESQVGTLTITSADTNSAVGHFSGTGTPGVGDHVKRH